MFAPREMIVQVGSCAMDPQVVIGILKGLPLPILVAAVALLAGWWKYGRKAAGGTEPHASASEIWPRWTAGLALAGAVIALYCVRIGTPDFPVRESVQWAPVAAVFALLVSILEPAGIARAKWRWALRGALIAGAVPFILHKRSQAGITAGEIAAWTAGFAVLATLAWYSMERTSAIRGWQGPLVLLTGVGLSSMTLVASGSVKLGEIAGGLAAALGVAVVLGIFLPRLSLAGAGTTTVALVMATLWLIGVHYSELPRLLMALLMLSAPASLLANLRQVNRLGGWKGAALRVMLAAAPCLAALAIAIPKAIEDSGEY